MTDASVLITVFNCENYIEKSVASALSQTIEHFEVVVIDDGSTDLTSEKLDDIKESRLKVSHCARMGRAKALNFGLEKCASAYVAILDADDISFPRRLQLQTGYLDCNPDIVLVGSQFRTFIDETGDLSGVEHLLPTEFHEIFGTLKDKKFPLPLFHSSITFRKDAIQALGGYDESLPCYLDFDLYVRVAAKLKIANIEERLSLKRLHPKQFFGGSHGMFSTPEGQQAWAKVMHRIDQLL